MLWERIKPAARAIPRAIPALLALVFCVTSANGAAYIPTARDTKLPPAKITYDLTVLNDYELLTKAGYFEYYYREDRDIIAVVDTRNGYTWKTGLDAGFKSDIDKAVKEAATDEEKIAAAVPQEDRLNATYIGFANSMVTAEYYDDAFNIQMISSASQEGAESKLMTVDNDPSHRLLEVNFSKIDLQVKVHVHLTADGITYEVKDEDIQGTGTAKMASLIITPFLGATGGGVVLYDPATKMYKDKELKPMTPGYIVIPDGSGTLIRFQDNTANLKKYVGSVYGVNFAETTFYYSSQTWAVTQKYPLMPVFGISHGENQAAFVAWADDGAEHMELIVSPEENMTYYYFAYPRFVFNNQIHQVYNRRGDGYFKLFPERNHFDFSMSYQFLADSGESDGYPADYAGMALAYRAHLLEIGRLELKDLSGDMPIRLDFVMSDIKKDVVGYSDVVTTTAEQVSDILEELHGLGVENINSGMLGAQKGGITTGKPWELKFTGKIGSSGDFKRLFDKMEALGIDVSFSQDYTRINSVQMMLSPNQASHINKWGIRYELMYSDTSPIDEIGFARPQKSAEWLLLQSKAASKVGAKSVTVTGMTNTLISHYGNNPISAEEAVELYQKTFSEIDMKINAETPNMYLWKNVDRFLNAPILSSQYIIGTDTVPFLQMVLHGSMEIYSPYANFSFYTKEDILRMIDYNVSPSFVLTSEPAYLLSNTSSSQYYSTEYSLYKDIILSVYNDVSSILNEVSNKMWLDRRVLENGVILNVYDGARVLINYTGNEVSYEGVTVAPLSAVVLTGSSGSGGGGNE